MLHESWKLNQTGRLENKGCELFMSETLVNIQYETTLDLIRYVLYFFIRRTDSVNPNQNHETFF